MPQQVGTERSTTPSLPGRSTAMGCLARAKGGLLLASAAGVAVLGWVVLNILGSNLQRPPEFVPRMSRLALWIIDHRWIVPAATLPAMLAGGWMLLPRSRAAGHRKQSHAAPWILWSLATAWLVIIFGAVLVTFVLFIAPFYQYEDIG